MSTKDSKDVVYWLANGEVGISSKTMAFWLEFGLKPKDSSHPHDPDDLDRCLRLLYMCPHLREKIPNMACLSPEWARLVAKWADIEASHLDEVGLGWTKARSAPKTYALMKAAIHGKL